MNKAFTKETDGQDDDDDLPSLPAIPKGSKNYMTPRGYQMLKAELLERRADSLSIGQQQRVAAARALIGQPELVIADEPTSALDFDAREAFLQLLFAECRAAGASLLFVSHDQSLAPLFDRSLSLSELNRAAKPVEV